MLDIIHGVQVINDKNVQFILVIEATKKYMRIKVKF